MTSITHFNIPADNVEKAKNFYTELFGWEIERLPGPFEYFEIRTKTAEGKEGLAGGLAKRMVPHEGITNYVDVPDIDEYLSKAEELGGKVISPKMPVPGFGFLAVIMDTENNSIGLWQTDKEAKAK